MSGPLTCPACGVEERCGCSCTTEEQLQAEVTFLNGMWDNARENYQKSLAELAAMSDLREMAREGCPTCGGTGDELCPITDHYGPVPCPECARITALLLAVQSETARACDRAAVFHIEPDDAGLRASDKIRALFPAAFEETSRAD